MKYTIEFAYWHFGSGYSHTEIFDSFDGNGDHYPTIGEYLDCSDLEWNQFADYCDMIMITMWKDGEIVSRAYWDGDGIRYEELDGYDADGRH